MAKTTAWSPAPAPAAVRNSARHATPPRVNTNPMMMTKYLPTPDLVLATSCGYLHGELPNGYLSV